MEKKKIGQKDMQSFFKVTSVNPVHNAQVCYFNNIWLMFLVF